MITDAEDALGADRAAGRRPRPTRVLGDRRGRAHADLRRVPRAVERAAAGLARLGIGEGTPVSWQLPTWLESLVLVGALARLGAVQNPILPIYREPRGRLHHQADRRGLLVVPVAVAAASTTRPWRTRCAERSPALEVLDRATSSCPRATRHAAAAPDARRPARTPVRWIFYTSGTTADPKGAQHTDGTIRRPRRA